jgi:hypothetical protein
MVKNHRRISGLVVVLALAMVTVASAAVFTNGKIYGGVFTGTQAGTQQWAFPSTSGGTLTYNCTSAQFTGKVQPTRRRTR